jgi:pimeloyl-ACP methyl ester carboxylesterase
MADFIYYGKNVYYEEHGAGEPLLLLNGIFMSCASWAAFVPVFGAELRLILVDFLDQGKSGRMESEYTQDLQAGLVSALLDHLKLEKAHILGISYGGEVAAQFAVKRPERVDRLILSNTTAYTSLWLRDIGRSWEYAFESRDGSRFFKTCIPIVYSPQFYEDNHEWMKAREDMFSKAFDAGTYEAFGRLTRSAETYDVRGGLRKITAPTLVMSSEYDYVTPPHQQRELAAMIPDAAHITVPSAGHALMYEKPSEFAAAVIGFLKLKALNIVKG